MGAATRKRAVLVRFGGTALRLQVMAGAVLAVTVALVMIVVWVDREAPAGEQAGDLLRVGVVDGQSVDGYLRSSREELARLAEPSAPAAGDTWALVAFDRYTTADAVTAMLMGVQVAQVYTRVPLGEARTPVLRIPVYQLPGDVIAGMLDAAQARDRERADYQRLSRGLAGEGRNETRLRAAYDSAAQAAAGEAAAYRTGCECVFAAVVRAVPAVLGRIAGQPWARVVDPAPEVRQLDRTEFRPPLPEEVDVVSPAPSAMPSAMLSVAPVAPAPLPSSIGVDVTSASPGNSGEGPSPSVLPSDGPLAVPSATDTSSAHKGLEASPGASTGEPGR